MEPSCRIELLGDVRLVVNGHVTTRFRTRKARALLAYLAREPGRIFSREALIEEFWPSTPEEEVNGPGNLSTCLYTLRNALAIVCPSNKRLLITDNDFVRLDKDGVCTDIMELDWLVEQASAAEDNLSRAHIFEQAAALYRGEVCHGIYADWVSDLRFQMGRKRIDANLQWAAALVSIGDLEAAREAVERLENDEPGEDEVCQELMKICAALNRPNAIRKTYYRLRRYLRDEMQTEPSPETAKLFERLLADPRVVGPMTNVVPGAASTAHSSVPPTCNLPTQSLPEPLTRFFGREQEIALLRSVLERERLVTLTGTGGIGKTRLAVEAARSALAYFGGRVWFIALDALEDPSLLSSRVARSLCVDPSSGGNALAQFGQELGSAHCLLVLDNIEHLLRETPPGNPLCESLAFLQMLLTAVPTLTCLVTSREPLLLAGEQVVSVRPLSVPDTASDLEILVTHSSVALYVDRARLLKPLFAVTTANGQAIRDLCRMLDGIPLAIEMAASWANVLSPKTMVERLKGRLDLLTSQNQDVPPRHLNLTATFDWSFDRLPTRAQWFFASLSIFRGSWSLDAVESICDASDALPLLAELCAKSLITMEVVGDEPRYRFLEVLREFASLRLLEQDRETLANKHVDYFLRLAEDAQDRLGAEQVLWYGRLDADIDNLWAALDCTLTTSQTELGLRLATALWHFCYVRGHQAECAKRLASLLDRRPATAPKVWLKALNAAGNLYYCLNELTLASELFNKSLQLAEKHDKASVVVGLGGLANIACATEDYRRARALFDQCLATYRSRNDRRKIALTLANLAIVERSDGNNRLARSRHEESNDIFRKLGDQVNLALGLNNLVDLRLMTGEIDQIDRLLGESLLLGGETGSMRNLAHSLAHFITLAIVQQERERAAVLMGAEDSIRRAYNVPVPPRAQVQHQECRQEIRDCLGDKLFQEAWMRGYSMSLDEMVLYALPIEVAR